VASLSQGRTAAAQCGLFTYKSVPVIFEPPCMYMKIIFCFFKLVFEDAIYEHFKINDSLKNYCEILTVLPCILILSSIFICPPNAQLDCSKRMLKFTFIFTLKVLLHVSV